jgi:hypothetical protein
LQHLVHFPVCCFCHRILPYTKFIVIFYLGAYLGNTQSAFPGLLVGHCEHFEFEI